MYVELKDYLSTESRKKILTCYMFGKKSQKEVGEGLGSNISASTIDRITHTLRYIRALKKV